MNIIFGFGSTEQEQKKQVFDWIYKNLQNHINKWVYEYDRFNLESFKKEFLEYAKVISKEYKKADKSEKKPERYFHIDYDTCMATEWETFFIKLCFWHINSRHPFSRDWMSLFQESVTYTFVYDELDGFFWY